MTTFLSYIHQLELEPFMDQEKNVPKDEVESLNSGSTLDCDMNEK